MKNRNKLVIAIWIVIGLTLAYVTNAQAAVEWKHDFDAITNTEKNHAKMMKYAESILPGVTNEVTFKVGDISGIQCRCGGWFTTEKINGKWKPVIAISNNAFNSNYVGGAYDLYYGYHPAAYETVAHEIAHYLNYKENGQFADGHGNRFKHFYQQLTPKHLWHFEAGYKYPGGEDMFDPDTVY